MASNETAISFDQIIQQARDRKKAEKLASTIFGKGRRDSAPQHRDKSKFPTSPSLASRIAKPSLRSSSSSSINRTRAVSAFNRAARAQNSVKRELFSSQPPANGHSGQGFSIKGAAGPYVVVGSNFAPGTTSADIKSATEAIAGEMLSCVIITSNPTVIAEMVFTEKEAAENLISALNNQKADGRLLHLYLKVGPPTRLESPGPASSLTVPVVHSRGSEDRSDLFSERSGGRAPRYVSDSMAEPDYSDGRYGFGGKVGEDTEMDYQAEAEDKQRDHRDDRYASDTRSDQRGYRQDHARANAPRPERYNPRGNQSRQDRRTYNSDRLYSDGMYNGSRGGGYRT